MIRLTIIVFVVMGAVGCKVPDPPPVSSEWKDDFERERIDGDYLPTADNYRIVGGALGAKGAFNHPLWLRKKLPRDVAIEFDCWSNSVDGDIKVELFGDGSSHAHDKGAYTSSGYVAVMGGWSNSKSILARGNEHGSELSERTTPKVVIKKHYHWKLVRRGTTLTWFVDDMDTPFLELVDPSPLEGRGHEYFGFNNWQSDTWFDNLTISPL